MSIAIPKSYRFAGIHCGIKDDPNLLDLSLIVSDLPAVAAGVYTQNLVCGAPVQVDRERTPGEGFRAVVVNSRNANACTGEQGYQDAKKMTELAANLLGAKPDKALVMSTGVIGNLMPMDKVAAGIKAAGTKLAADEKSFMDAARGFMTTDTFEKIASKTFVISTGETVTICGICKGAAMIAPNMATMLAVVMCDAKLDPQTAQKMLKDAADDSFNCVSVEGHTSTSDTLLFLANGAVRSEPLSGTDLELCAVALREICTELAMMIPADGEGCTHRITINVSGCKDRSSAKSIAKTIAESALVKTAVCGADPNWGRIVSAAGYAGVPFDPMKVGLKINGHEVYRNGTPLKFDAKTVSNDIRNNRETLFEISFGEGETGMTFWTTDLTAEYVRLNADYTS